MSAAIPSDQNFVSQFSPMTQLEALDTILSACLITASFFIAKVEAVDFMYSSINRREKITKCVP